MQVLKEKKALGIRYFGRMGILIINAVLVLVFSNMAVWMMELFSDVSRMNYMDAMLEIHASFDKQLTAMGIVMVLLGSIPAAALFLILCTFITSVLKTRKMEEYMLYCLGYTEGQMMTRELLYIGFDTVIAYGISAVVFPLIMGCISKNKYMIMLQENFHTDIEIYYKIYIVFAVVLMGVVICKGKHIIESNLKEKRR